MLVTASLPAVIPEGSIWSVMNALESCPHVHKGDKSYFDLIPYTKGYCPACKRTNNTRLLLKIA